MIYEKQATNFAIKHGIKLKVLSVDYKKHFVDDKVERYIFKLKLTRNKKSYTFEFGQSISNGNKEPTMYDILSCLTKYDVGNFDNFCSVFGYQYNTIEERMRIAKVYNAVCKEFEAVERLFDDIIEDLKDIQ